MKRVYFIIPVLSLLLVFSAFIAPNARNDKSPKLTQEQEAAYEAFKKFKTEARYSFRLSEKEAIMFKKKDAKGLRKSLGYTSKGMSKLLSQTVNEPMHPLTPIGPEVDDEPQAAQVIVCESYGNNQYHCYELANFETCPEAYSLIPNVECIEF